MISSKWNVWRIINSVAILFSFFMPWGVMEGDVNDLSNALIFTGFEMLQWYRRLGLTFAFDSDLPSHDRISIATFLLVRCFLGLATTLIYCALNMIAAVFKTKLVDKSVWAILPFCLIALGGLSLWSIPVLHITDWVGNWRSLSHALLGYWLALIGLVSSIVLEIYYLRSKRTK